MQTNVTHIGNAAQILPQLEANSIHCVITSPPYYGLRDYGVEGQLGMEESPREYLNKLVSCFEEVRRVLRDDGTFWLNINDSYTNLHRKTTANQKNSKRRRLDGDPFGEMLYGKRRALNGNDMGLKDKDLMLIPFRLAIALQEAGWYVRCDIIWHKPNGLPESPKDRPTRNHEYLFLLTKNKRYYFDYEAVLEPYITPLNRWGGEDRTGNIGTWDAETGQPTNRQRKSRPNPKGRRRRSVWSINTRPSGVPHYASYPEKLIEPCVLAGCPEGGIVLDPFFGIGTTGRVAKRLGRQYIGIELKPEYAEIAKQRLNEQQIIGRVEENA